MMKIFKRVFDHLVDIRCYMIEECFQILIFYSFNLDQKARQKKEDPTK